MSEAPESRTEEPLWTPSCERVERSRMARWIRERGFASYAELHRWSVDEPEAFWSAVWDDCGVRGDRGAEPFLIDGDRMPGARWFPDARLNFAENLLRRNDAAPAIVFRGESGVRRELSFRDLGERVARAAADLCGAGVVAGDRVAGLLPNLPDTVVAMLATTRLGAIWSSCSPDFGARGVLDRFGQIEPRVLFAADGYDYAGRRFDTLVRLPEILAGLPSVERVVAVPYPRGDGDEGRGDLSPLRGAERDAVWMDDFLSASRGPAPDFERLPFDHPVYILYSSGTTGRPKCIVHGAGGTLLQHLKEHRLHVDLREDDRLFYFTTCGWMMWNWLASGLASGATLVLYDGSPFEPDANALFDLAQQEQLDVMGVGAKWIDAVTKAGIEPRRSHDLGRLRTILSTGSPLLPQGFDTIYQRVKRDVQLASISGGTDILSCFVLGEPTSPVWRGEIQAPGLGMSVQVLDGAGRRVIGERGELGCTRPFPSMPVGFWRDPEQRRYRAAYFERFADVWCHGDWCRETERGGFVIDGRSDAVLNPGGVRIGTAEIYRQVEALDEVVESVAVGRERDGDVQIVLFVVLRDGIRLDDSLRDTIRRTLRSNASPRHVPARILQVGDIPRTRSGKITELAVRDVVEGREVGNAEALANPEALEEFRDRPELRD